MLVLAFAILCHFTVALSYSITVYPDCSQDERGLLQPFSDSSGSGQICMEIDNVLDELESRTTVRLEPGTHVIRRPHLSDIRGLRDVSISGSGAMETVITCEHTLGLAFIGIENLVLSNFTITNCGLTGANLEFPLNLLKQSLDLWIFVPLFIRVALFIGDSKDVMIENIHITNTTGLGLLGINIIGISTLIGVNFTRNIRPRCLDMEPTLPAFITPDIYDQVGGGAYFLYTDYKQDVSKDLGSASLILTRCYFAHNADCTYTSVISVNFPFYTANGIGLYEYSVGAGGGLSVVLASSSFQVDVVVHDTTFYRNDARYGGGVYVASFAGFRHPVTVVFYECSFLENGMASSEGDSVIRETYCRGGAGLSIFTDLVKPDHFINSIPSPGENNLIVGVLNSSFVRNMAEFQGGGIMAYSFFSTPHTNLDVRSVSHYSIFWVIYNVTFTENFARYTSAVYVRQLATFGIGGSVWLVIEDLNVTNNYNQIAPENFRGADQEVCAFHIKEVTCTVRNSNTFSDNSGSALRIESTYVSLIEGGSITFHQNLAHRGGALYFTGYSPGILLSPNCSLDFVDNRAVVEGGAIYYDPLGTPPEILQPLNSFGCFITTSVSAGFNNPDGHFGLFNSNITITFTNNSAPLGGMVYGTSLESCPWAINITRVDGLSFFQVLERFNSTFIFSEEPVGGNLVSTLPAYLDVTLLSSSSVFPGQIILVGIEVYDIYGSTIPEVVTSVIEDQSISAYSILGNSGSWHTSVYESELQIMGDYEGFLNVSIVTETNSVSSTLSVYLTPCPIGFFIDPVNRRCTCDQLLRNTPGVQCFEDSVSYNVSRNQWIGVNPDIIGPNSSDLIIHRCILNYCDRAEDDSINPPDFDTQCAANRAGLLCGDCEEGYSAVFGTNECLRCSNYWLLLIPVYALGGAVLFAAIALLEITIDKGLTNAAIFFASLVSFFEFLTTNVYLYLPFRLLALQLGVGTCFFDGMTALHRSFLLFVFPTYLYALMAIFTLLCRRYTWMSVHFSPAKTLATLTVMCYLSILTTTIDLLVGTSVKSLGGDSSLRWLIYPKLQYFTGAHAFLTILGFAIAIFYLLPFPLLFFFPPLAYKYLKRFSPFFDVLWEAYKPKLRFWLGIRVILIIVLYLITRAPVVFAYTLSGVIILLFTNIQTVIQPFKDRWTNYIDSILTTLVTVYFWGTQVIVNTEYTHSIQVLAGVYLGTFALVSYVVYFFMFGLHIHRQFPTFWPMLVRKIKLRRVKIENTSVSSTVIELDPHDPTEDDDQLGRSVTRSSVHMPQSPTIFPSKMLVGSPRYRESLLGSGTGT